MKKLSSLAIFAAGIIIVGCTVTRNMAITSDLSKIEQTLKEFATYSVDSSSNSLHLKDKGSDPPPAVSTPEEKIIDSDIDTPPSSLLNIDMFNSNESGGGLVILYHVAKTGGTSIAELFRIMKHDKSTRHKFAFQRLGFRTRHEKFANEDGPQKQINQVDGYLNGKNSKILLLEVHTSRFGGFHPDHGVLSSKLDHWVSY